MRCETAFGVDHSDADIALATVRFEEVGDTDINFDGKWLAADGTEIIVEGVDVPLHPSF